MSVNTIHILSPKTSQAQAIAAFIHRYFPEVSIVGVVFEDESTSLPRGVYSDFALLSHLEVGRADSVLIPTGSRSTKYFLEKGDVTVGAVTLTQPALRVYDKPWMIARSAEIGIPTPATWQQLRDVTGYPVFYKQRYEQGGGPRGIAQAESDIPTHGRDQLIFQEVIESPGTYGVAFLAENGRLRVKQTHFESESVPRAGGSAVIIERYEHHLLLEYTRWLIDLLGYSGWGLVEFKRDPDRDDFFFMEINAKFWASCEFSFVNEPLFLKLLFGIDSQEKSVNRMFFIDRASDRGVFFVLSHLGHLANGSALRAYPGWQRQIAVAATPSVLRPLCSKLLTRTRKVWRRVTS